jgi:ParB family transcriptional regulator, chromosome partitioning protein
MTTMTEKRKALGRGLESLLPGGPRVVPPVSPARTESQKERAEPRPGEDVRASSEKVRASENIQGAAVEGTELDSTPLVDGANTTGDPGIAVIGTSAVVAEIEAAAHKAVDGEVLKIALDRIDENPYQTRVHMYEEELQELAESIKASGVLQPIVVRPGESGRYLLIVGERRCKASKLAGLKTIPAIVRIVSDEQAAEMTIIENLQREDLNPLEQAYAFVRLSRDFGLTQEQIGLKTGISRESVSNYMRLARLPEDVQGRIIRKELDFSMARLLLSLDTPEQISRAAKIAADKRMTVEQLETLVYEIGTPIQRDPQEKRSRWVDPNVRAAQRDLEQRLGMRVRIKDRRGKGKIVIEYSTLEDFDRVLDVLKGK